MVVGYQRECKMKKVVISVGSFVPHMVREYLNRGFKVIAYDPRKEVYERYLKIKDDNFFPHNEAVVADESGKQVFLKILRARPERLLRPGQSKDPEKGSSTQNIEGENFDNNYEFDGIVGKYPVPSVSIRSILEGYVEIEELHLICEGEEIPIIQKTPIDLFRRCKTIISTFPWKYPHLHQTEEMAKECIRKLSQYFTAKKIIHCTWRFDRKVNVGK